MMIEKPSNIIGGRATDQRGTISFVNDFDMNQVRRFYMIENSDTQIVRGWRAHRIEQRWFHVIQGEFKIGLVEIDNWENPSKRLSITYYIISTKNMEVFHIPVGYAISIQALEADSKLMVFADQVIENAKLDDYLFPVDYFDNN
jgi:dTDP-4-dehydrorhamnose 3,5-epimerase